jgi:hypothetical protein
MLGGALSVLFAFVGENNWAHVPLDAARYAPLVVGVAGLYLYLRQSRGFGRLGVVSFYVCIFVFALVAVLDLGIIVNEGVTANIHRPRSGARSPATHGFAALWRSRTAGGKAAGWRSVATHRRGAHQCGRHTGHDYLWRYARRLGLYRAHGAIRAGMGVAGVRALVAEGRIGGATFARELANRRLVGRLWVQGRLHLQDSMAEDIHDLGLAPAQDPLLIRPVEVDVPV